MRRSQPTPAAQRLHGSRKPRNAVVKFTKESSDAPQPQATSASSELQVEQIMTKDPIVLDQDMDIREAVKQLLDSGVGGAPVVDSQRRLVGVLSESDVIWKGAGTPLDHYLIPPTYISILDAIVQLRDQKQTDEDIQKILSRTVREAMTRDVVSIAPTATLAQAASLMLTHKVNRLPVVWGQAVVGVITRHDVLKGIYDTHTFM